jgi:hypothetical protein
MSEFIVDAVGPEGLFGVFEDDGDTGYLYLYNPEEGKILRHVHIYDRSKCVDVAPSDVQVAWNSDGTKCGVIIWGMMRGVIDLRNNREGRAWIEGRETPGISDPEWLDGFKSA